MLSLFHEEHSFSCFLGEMCRGSFRKFDTKCFRLSARGKNTLLPKFSQLHLSSSIYENSNHISKNIQSSTSLLYLSKWKYANQMHLKVLGALWKYTYERQTFGANYAKANISCFHLQVNKLKWFAFSAPMFGAEFCITSLTRLGINKTWQSSPPNSNMCTSRNARCILLSFVIRLFKGGVVQSASIKTFSTKSVTCLWDFKCCCCWIVRLLNVCVFNIEGCGLPNVQMLH